MKIWLIPAAALLVSAAAPAVRLDPDTAAWWAITAQLSNDSMEGRDTGSPAYLRAARLVAAKFAAAGLRPAGENGSWFQNVPMHEIRVTAAQLGAGDRRLVFLHDLTISPNAGMPEKVDAPLAYGGYCGAGSLGGVRGRIVICHGTRRPGLPTGAEREAAARAAGAIGMLTIADPGFTVEPPRWPYAYARTVTLASDPEKPDAFLRMTLNADSLGKLIAGSGRSAAALIAAGSAGQPLPSFAIPRDSMRGSRFASATSARPTCSRTCRGAIRSSRTKSSSSPRTSTVTATASRCTVTGFTTGRSTTRPMSRS